MERPLCIVVTWSGPLMVRYRQGVELLGGIPDLVARILNVTNKLTQTFDKFAMYRSQTKRWII